MAYTKLDEGIVRSTVWREPDHVLRVWIAILALKNRHGEVLSSIPGLADIARVTLPECEEALQRFHEPDKYSRTQDHDGRRLETIDGGWFVLNHEKYRENGDLDDRRRKDADRAKRARNRKKGVLEPVLDGFQEPPASRDRHVTSRDVTQKSRQADADADAGTTTAASRAKANWLSPYLTCWREVMPKVKDKALAGPLARAIRPLTDDHPPEAICAQLRLYLAQVGSQYATPAGFARAFGTWTGKRSGNGVDDRVTRGRVALAESLTRREAQTNGKPSRHREVSRDVPRALPHARGHDVDR